MLPAVHMVCKPAALSFSLRRQGETVFLLINDAVVTLFEFLFKFKFVHIIHCIVCVCKGYFKRETEGRLMMCNLSVISHDSFHPIIALSKVNVKGATFEHPWIS